MQTTIQHHALQHVPQSHRETADAAQRRLRYVGVAVWRRTSLRVTVTLAMHLMVTASRVALRVWRAAAASQSTVIRLDVVLHRHQQRLLKQVLRDVSLIDIRLNYVATQSEIL